LAYRHTETHNAINNASIIPSSGSVTTVGLGYKWIGTVLLSIDMTSIEVADDIHYHINAPSKVFRLVIIRGGKRAEILQFATQQTFEPPSFSPMHLTILIEEVELEATIRWIIGWSEGGDLVLDDFQTIDKVYMECNLPAAYPGGLNALENIPASPIEYVCLKWARYTTSFNPCATQVPYSADYSIIAPSPMDDRACWPHCGWSPNDQALIPDYSQGPYMNRVLTCEVGKTYTFNATARFSSQGAGYVFGWNIAFFDAANNCVGYFVDPLNPIPNWTQPQDFTHSFTLTETAPAGAVSVEVQLFADGLVNSSTKIYLKSWSIS
jgi:hypothetical protein